MIKSLLLGINKRELKREFSFRASFFKSNTVITTLYFGGGTPSVLNLDEFKEIILELNRIFDLSKIEELTVELNPDDVSLEYLSGLKNLGVNRVSFAVQSFHDKYLKVNHFSISSSCSFHNRFRKGRVGVNRV